MRPKLHKSFSFPLSVRSSARKSVPIANGFPSLNAKRACPKPAKNQRLRSNRRDVRRQADAVMEYWHDENGWRDFPRSKFRHARRRSASYPQAGHCWALIGKYREAWARLMLTPAPDMLSVTWKRAQLQAENHKHTDLKPERIERAIADDVEFLRTHPTRRSSRSNSNA
jgi:hypothetical protein